MISPLLITTLSASRMVLNRWASQNCAALHEMKAGLSGMRTSGAGCQHCWWLRPAPGSRIRKDGPRDAKQLALTLAQVARSSFNFVW